MTALQATLRRHYTVNTRPTSQQALRDAHRVEDITGHPPIPAAALPHLHTHLTGDPDASGPVRWHHERGLEWAAVVDLHRAGDHTAAGELARFLVWLQPFGQGWRQDHTSWELTVDGGA